MYVKTPINNDFTLSLHRYSSSVPTNLVSQPKLGPDSDGYLKSNEDRRPPPAPNQTEHNTPNSG